MLRFKFREGMKSIQMLYNHYYEQFVLSHSYSIICCGLLKWRIIVSSDGDAYTLWFQFSATKETTTVREIFMKKKRKCNKEFVHSLFGFAAIAANALATTNIHTYTRIADAFSCFLLAYNFCDCGRISGQSVTSLNRR